MTCPLLETATKRARATRRNLLHVPYGDGEGEKLDIYFPEQVSEGRRMGGWSRSRAQLGTRLSPHALCLSSSLAFLCVLPWRVLAERKVSRELG